MDLAPKRRRSGVSGPVISIAPDPLSYASNSGRLPIPPPGALQLTNKNGVFDDQPSPRIQQGDHSAAANGAREAKPAGVSPGHGQEITNSVLKRVDAAMVPAPIVCLKKPNIFPI